MYFHLPAKVHYFPTEFRFVSYRGACAVQEGGGWLRQVSTSASVPARVCAVHWMSNFSCEVELGLGLLREGQATLAQGRCALRMWRRNPGISVLNCGVQLCNPGRVRPPGGGAWRMKRMQVEGWCSHYGWFQGWNNFLKSSFVVEGFWFWFLFVWNQLKPNLTFTFRHHLLVITQGRGLLHCWDLLQQKNYITWDSTYPFFIRGSNLTIMVIFFYAVYPRT